MTLRGGGSADVAERLTLEQLKAAEKRAIWRLEIRQDKRAAASLQAIRTRIAKVEAQKS